MPLSEAEELELLELEEAEFQESQGQAPEPEPVVSDENAVASSEPWLEAGPVRIEKSPFDVNWLGAAKDSFSAPMDPSAKAAVSGPLGYMAGSIAGGAATSKALGAVGSVAKGAAEKFATSPLPGKIADATNVVGKGKGLVEKFTGMVGDNLSPRTKQVMDYVSGAVGRKAAYSNPVTGVPQAISDTAKVAQGAQKGMAWLLDNAPEKLGKFASVAKEALASGGPQALATTEFILSQSSPEYQKIQKDVRTGE